MTVEEAPHRAQCPPPIDARGAFRKVSTAPTPIAEELFQSIRQTTAPPITAEAGVNGHFLSFVARAPRFLHDVAGQRERDALSPLKY